MTDLWEDEGRKVAEAVRGALRTLAPERDLWPDISRKLAPRRSGWVRGSLAIAAAVVLMAVGVWWAPAGNWLQRGPPAGRSTAAFAEKVVNRRDPSMDLVWHAAHDPYLPYATRAVLISNLLILHHAQLALARAMTRHPDTPGLSDLMIHLESERARFMTSVEEAQIQSNPRIML